jgi:hypothetical protein
VIGFRGRAGRLPKDFPSGMDARGHAGAARRARVSPRPPGSGGLFVLRDMLWGEGACGQATAFCGGMPKRKILRISGYSG